MPLTPADAAGAVAAVLALVLPTLRPVRDADIWWHLKAGEALLAGAPDAFRESWSFTAAGRPWLNHEWLAELALAGAHRLGDPTGLWLLSMALLAATALLLFRAARREGFPAGLAAALLALAAAAAGDRFLPRPQLFTYLALALVFDRVGAARAARRTPWELLGVQALWTNAHGAVVGLAVLGLLLAGGALPDLSWRRRGAFMAALVAASCLAPQGPLPLLDNLRQLAGGGLYRQTVSEWLPLLDPGQRGLPQAPAALALCGLALAAGAAGLVTARRGRPGYALLLLALGAAPLAAVRNRDLLAMAALPALAALPLVAAWRAPRAAGPVGGLLAAALLVAPNAGLAGYPPPVVRPGLVATGSPVGAVRFLQREPVGRRVFNVYDQGGYLVHELAPARRVFVDGRYFVYGEALYRDYLELRDGAPDARERLRRADADLLVLRYPAADGYMGLARAAAGWPEWHLVYWDDESLLYARDDAAPTAWLAAHGYSLAHPLVSQARATDAAWWQANAIGLVREAWRASGEAPDAIRPRLTLAVALEYAGRPGDAARTYREILAAHPAARPAREGLERLRAANGGTEPAAPPESTFRAVFGLPPRPTGPDPDGR